MSRESSSSGGNNLSFFGRELHSQLLQRSLDSRGYVHFRSAGNRSSFRRFLDRAKACFSRPRVLEIDISESTYTSYKAHSIEKLYSVVPESYWQPYTQQQAHVAISVFLDGNKCILSDALVQKIEEAQQRILSNRRRFVLNWFAK